MCHISARQFEEAEVIRVINLESKRKEQVRASLYIHPSKPRMNIYEFYILKF